MWHELIVLVVAAVAITSAQKTQCRHNSECGSDECCYYHEGPMVVSKRDVLMPVFSGMVQGGWCEKYKKEGEYCSGIGKMNGHCECAPGLKCTFIKDPTIPPPTAVLMKLPPIVKRMMIWGGHSECQIDTSASP